MFSNKVLAGALLFLAGAIILMGIISGEIFYPAAYTTFSNEISDLGSTLPPNVVIYPVPSSIFNATMLISGLMIFAAAYLMYKAKMKLMSKMPIAVLGAGLFLIGVFPANNEPLHQIIAFVVFLSGGVAALGISRITKPLFSYISILFGLVVLITLFIRLTFPAVIFSTLGPGGVERWIAYPLLLWLCGFGGYLMSRAE